MSSTDHVVKVRTLPDMEVEVHEADGWTVVNEPQGVLAIKEEDRIIAAYSPMGWMAVWFEELLPERPEVVCLCGSTRFYDEFQKANYDLTMQGKIVLSVGFYPHAKERSGHGEGVGHDSAEKVMLDELHKRKIDLADRVFVINVGNYIGESTKGEIEYARAHGKRIEFMEPVL